MKLSLLQENLAKGVNTVSRMVTGKTQLPVLANILLKTEQGKIRLSTTNLETGMNLWLGSKVEEKGKITIPARMFGELVGALPQDTVTIEAKEEKLKLECGKVKAMINGIAAEEFPQMPTMKKEGAGAKFKLKAAELLTAVKQVAFAAGTDEGRPIFTGVKLELRGKEMRLAATDGYRLSVKKLSGVIGSKEEKELVVPAKALMEMGKIVAAGDGEAAAGQKQREVEVAVTDEETQMILAIHQPMEVEIVTRLIEGDFPDFDKIIPASSKTKMELDKEELLRAVRTAAIFARDSANIVKFKIEGERLKVSANAPQIGENEVELEGKKSGEDGEIAFNCRYLLELLTAVEGERLRLETGGTLSPGVFRMLGDESFLHIIMPVRVQE